MHILPFHPFSTTMARSLPYSEAREEVEKMAYIILAFIYLVVWACVSLRTA